jgi:dihydroneopterin aldolase
MDAHDVGPCRNSQHDACQRALQAVVRRSVVEDGADEPLAAGPDQERQPQGVAQFAEPVKDLEAVLGSLPESEDLAGTAPDLPGQVSLRGILASGRHGVGHDERSRPQRFEVDVTLDTDLAAAAAGDNLDDTVDYVALQALVMTCVSQDSHHLIETLAARIGRAALDRWPAVGEVSVTVRKPDAPLPDPGRAEVRVRLRRPR